MKKYIHIPSLIIALISILFSCNQQIPEKPNVILIMADDMGYECLSINGTTEYDTPVLDQLAQTGINVSHCISQPLCTPSRVKIMTGLYNYRNYEAFEYLNPDSYTFGQLMKDAGYHTAIAGKWQLNGRHAKKEGWQDLNRPFHFGFDEYCLWQVTKGRQEGERYADPLIYKNAMEMKGLEDAYGPDIFTDFILDFIQKHKDEPFFIYYPMVLVHEPFVPTPDSEEWADPSGRNERDTSYFEDMVEYTDKIVGKIVAKLDVTGNMDNTLLIFTGDNGTDVHIYTDMIEGTYRGGKGKPSDPGTRVPLVISWPAVIEKPLFYNGLVEFSDFFATLADITDQEQSSEGKSFLPLLTGESDLHRKTAFVHYDPRWGRFEKARFIRTLTYKLYEDGRFYDMLKDPREKEPLDTTNLSLIEKETLEMLKNELAEHPTGKLVE